jgi:hypothetical protein
MSELRPDPTRASWSDATGIYCRVKAENGAWEVVDIAELDRQSLLAFLTSRGGSNPWAEGVVGIMLGHGNLRDGHEPPAHDWRATSTKTESGYNG